MSEFLIILCLCALWYLMLRLLNQLWSAYGSGRSDAVERVDDPKERTGLDGYFYQRGRSKAPRRHTKERPSDEDLTN